MVLDIQQRISTIFFLWWRRTLSTLLRCRNLSSLVLGSWLCLIPNNTSTQCYMLPWRRTLSTLPQCKTFSYLVLGIIMVLGTQQNISTIFYSSTTSEPLHTYTMQENLLYCSRNDYGAWYPTMDLNNILRILGVEPFSHFYIVGSSPLLFYESLWWLIPKIRLAQSSTVRWHRTISTLSLCRNFYSFILGIILVLDTQQWINTSSMLP